MRIVIASMVMLTLVACSSSDDAPSTQPVTPTETTPGNPLNPFDPTGPTAPIEPTVPVVPTVPEDPIDPVDPVEPTNPTDPAEPTDPIEPVEPTEPTDPVAACSVLDLNRWVDTGMKDFYLFYDQVPDLNLDEFESPEELIRALRFEERDDFSNVANKATQLALFEEGKSFGLGFNLSLDADNNVRVTYVYQASPMGVAGVRRGDILVSLNGQDISQLTNQDFDDAIGTQEAPKIATFEFIQHDSGNTVSYDIQMAEFSVNTVLKAQVINKREQPDIKIGYIVFKNFLETSAAELDREFSRFSEANISELVLDLRYNGGGRVSIARKLASLIGGAVTDGQLLTRYEFNDKYSDNNFGFEFQTEDNALNLSRVIIITTGRTASASEIVINSLRPYLDVVTIGTRSTGKPYISYGRDYCDKIMNAIEAEGFNAAGVSVFGGIAPSCAAFDNPVTDFGIDGSSNLNEMDSMLADALRYIDDGTCTPPALAQRTSNAKLKFKLLFEQMPTGAIEIR